MASFKYLAVVFLFLISLLSLLDASPVATSKIAEDGIAKETENVHLMDTSEVVPHAKAGFPPCLKDILSFLWSLIHSCGAPEGSGSTSPSASSGSTSRPSASSGSSASSGPSASSGSTSRPSASSGSTSRPSVSNGPSASSGSPSHLLAAQVQAQLSKVTSKQLPPGN